MCVGLCCAVRCGAALRCATLDPSSPPIDVGMGPERREREAFVRSDRVGRLGDFSAVHAGWMPHPGMSLWRRGGERRLDVVHLDTESGELEGGGEGELQQEGVGGRRCCNARGLPRATALPPLAHDVLAERIPCAARYCLLLPVLGPVTGGGSMGAREHSYEVVGLVLVFAGNYYSTYSTYVTIILIASQ